MPKKFVCSLCEEQVKKEGKTLAPKKLTLSTTFSATKQAINSGMKTDKLAYLPSVFIMKL